MRRSLAVAAALAVLPLAALAGCSAASQPMQPSPPAHVTQAALATTAPATQPLNPPAAAAMTAPTASLATFRWSTLASSPLGYRNSPLLAWAGNRLIEVGGWPKNSTGKSAAAASFDPATGRWRRIANAHGRQRPGPQRHLGR